MKQATLIAIMSNTGDERGLSGVRVISTVNGKDVTRDIDIDTLRSMLVKNPDAVENIRLNSNNNFEFTNGACNRYPNLFNNNLDLSKLIILNSYSNKQGEDAKIYKLCNCRGQTCIVNETKALKYFDRNGVANGKVVEKNGKRIISAIKGTYEVKSIEDIAMDDSTKEKIVKLMYKEENIMNLKVTEALNDIIDKLDINDTDFDTANMAFIQGFEEVFKLHNKEYAIEKLTLKIANKDVREIDMVSFQFNKNNKGGKVLEGYFVINIELARYITVWGIHISIKNINEKVLCTCSVRKNIDTKIGSNMAIDDNLMVMIGRVHAKAYMRHDNTTKEDKIVQPVKTDASKSKGILYKASLCRASKSLTELSKETILDIERKMNDAIEINNSNVLALSENEDNFIPLSSSSSHGSYYIDSLARELNNIGVYYTKQNVYIKGIRGTECGIETISFKAVCNKRNVRIIEGLYIIESDMGNRSMARAVIVTAVIDEEDNSILSNCTFGYYADDKRDEVKKKDLAYNRVHKFFKLND